MEISIASTTQVIIDMFEVNVLPVLIVAGALIGFGVWLHLIKVLLTRR